MSTTVQKYIPKDGDPVLPLFSLKGKTAIVTGAGAGIGLAVADCLAEAGANVAFFYNSNRKAIERAEETAKKYGVQCKAYKLDITSQESVESTVDQVVSEFNGRLDIFVANAGIPWTKGPILDAKDHKHYHKVISSDLDSVYYSAFAAGKHFKSAGSGSFIATASMSGHIVNTPQAQSAYNAAKAGVIHFCKSLAVEWAGFARVNTVSPGYIATEISNFVPQETKKVWHEKTPMGREGLANELKGAYLYFASDASTFTTGSDLIVDGYVFPCLCWCEKC
ncbi:NAD(P)-binding protein [Wilcoxina mikolae CBS 423.85]|nr:NAD(P)-binding protein [Wilcoxina mikolae CBS 423.85]